MTDNSMVRIGLRRASKGAFQEKNVPWRPYDIETGKELEMTGIEIVSVIDEPLKVRISTLVYEVGDEPNAVPHIRFADEETAPE